jgi:thiosulfate/3-mercaptopyruvate sulfurtransferase
MLRQVSRHLAASSGVLPRRYVSAAASAASDGMESGLVSVEWLAKELKAEGAAPLRVLDASWFLGGKDFGGTERDAKAEFAAARIPGAAFFDVDQVADTAATDLPHMMPDVATFAAAMKELGVDKGTRVVAYDALGMFSAPRCWYTLRTFGHPCVAVLDGGMHAWKEAGLELEAGPPTAPAPAADEDWTKDDAAVWDLGAVVANAAAGPETPVQLVDARPGPRFEGTAPEPREGMRGGHVPHSFNVPFGAVVNDFPAGPITLKNDEELAAVFTAAGVDVSQGGRPITTSCGSGMTAAIVGLALHRLGKSSMLYDGSWSEYGLPGEHPVVKTEDE